MSNGIEQKFTAFCSWVEAATGRPVIKARRGMNVQMNQPYCAVDLLEAPLITKDLELYVDQHSDSFEFPIIERIRGLVLATFQISSFGGDAVQCLHRLHASLKTDAWLVFAKKNSFGTAGGDGVQNLAAEFLSATFENRAQMKLTFYIPVPVDFEEDYFIGGDIDVYAPEKQEEPIFTTTYGQR